MSLDVYLEMKGAAVPPGSGIFVRENGQQREISQAEWDEKFPGREPVRLINQSESDEVYSANITHNLTRMADSAGIYQQLWRPDEIGITKASQLVEPLEAGLTLLRQEPERFKAFNPKNGWGDYDGLVTFVESYLAACREYPEADVTVSR